MNDDDNHEVESEDGDASQLEEGALEPVESAAGDRRDRDVGFRMPAGFSWSLLPNMDDLIARVLVPLQKQIRSSMPDYSVIAREALAPMNEQLREQMASIASGVPTYSMSLLDLPALQALFVSPVTQEILKQISEQQAKAMEGLRKSLGPLFAPESLRGLNRALLPPNLKDHADEIGANQVHEFVEQEGIPLYLVPRGRTALRLLRAKDRAGRRRVLGECYKSLMEDCAVVLERADHEVISDELNFVLDGLGAMRAGYVRSAQAVFTVVLDTLIYRFYPDREERRVITNHKRGADVPDKIVKMGVREALVWLPIWNSHEEFWKHKGDKVPQYYSRHASVHGVSSRQFSKRNCVQVLMLVTSLIGHVNQMAREASYGALPV
ncbi:hypothetical protein [Actinomyces ruminis]|uniref:Uncharacterized protein n=1 Tax=Actinomyces ruminis TaxID=1937003 RepID=A0ABX4MCL1_9ACTO|nr:hypothetical protein [Actinomyces ruminis]PHP53233.1 hypothetical protein BW737_004095 [Actinomyces ruminis]